MSDLAPPLSSTPPLPSSTPPSPSSTPAVLAVLGPALVARGVCDERTVERARLVARDSGQRLDAVLIQLGLISERALTETLASLLGLRIAAVANYPREPLFADRLAARFLQAARALPMALRGGTLVVALADPLDEFTPAAIAAAVGHPVMREIAVPIELEAALRRLYPPDGDSEGATGSGAGRAPDGVEDAARNEALEGDSERLRDLASEAPVIRLVNQIIARAVETQASDIHLEPFEDRLRVRYRYDGVLHEAESPPARLTAAIVSRVKIMARLDIAERRLPQDGRIKLAVRGTDIDFRVSTVPSLHGETVVVRVLDRSSVVFDYARLGLPAPVVARLAAALDLPNGIVLVTGPTGSGKTTTLYTSLLALNAVTRKIVTVEDPIEYQLAGINQIQVHEQIGLRFDTLLRSILRQDPDIIMVGEIRNLETAQMAVQAALTGHLVLSTVHTNSAAATVTRLRDMGVEDYLMTAVLRGVLAQRLVRRLCPHCRRPAPAPPELVRRFRLDERQRGGRQEGQGTGGDGAMTLWHPVGCAQCRDTGYRGRVAIAEFLAPDAEIERLIFARADQAAVERAAIAAGMRTMFESGLDAVCDGVTTIEEVVRSIRADP